MPDVRITPLQSDGPGPRVLTIDAEDWFHVCGNPEYSDPRRWDAFVPRVEATLGWLFETLGRGGHRATVFFLGWIARRYPQLVREAAHRGHEIAVHGDLHRRADEMTDAEMRDDLARAREAIEEAGGSEALAHRAAEWSIRRATAPGLRVVATSGFRCDASIMPVPPLGSRSNPRGPHRVDGDGWSLTEVPPLTGSVLGVALPLGGAWPFRTLPRRRLARAEREARARREPAVFTLHPWEVDESHPPMPDLSPIERAVHFAGLSGMRERFSRWLDEERTVALADTLPGLRPA